MRRFTIFVTHNMDMELDKAKRETYYKDTQNEMIRDLIMSVPAFGFDIAASAAANRGQPLQN